MSYRRIRAVLLFFTAMAVFVIFYTNSEYPGFLTIQALDIIGTNSSTKRSVDGDTYFRTSDEAPLPGATFISEDISPVTMLNELRSSTVTRSSAISSEEFQHTKSTTIQPDKEEFESLPKWMKTYVEETRRWRSSPASEKKYLIFAVDKVETPQRGLGDRLRGLVYSFYWAIATDRIFLIHWNSPFNLSDVVIPVPKSIDWLTNASELFQESQKFQCFDKHNNKGACGEAWKSEGNFGRILSVQTNIAHALYATTFLRTPGPVRDYFLRLNYTTRSLKPLFSWAFTVLFKPREMLEVNLASYRSSLKLQPDEQYVSLHIRLGSSAKDITWRDPPRHSLKEIPKLVKCGARMQMYLKTNNLTVHQLPLIMFSDSNKAKHDAQLLNPDLRISTGGIVHIELSSRKSLKDFKKGYLDTWTEFLLMSRSRCVVYSKSGFSVVAANFGFSNFNYGCYTDFRSCSIT